MLYDLYFLRRFIEEMVLSQTAASKRERDCHRRLSGIFADLLGMSPEAPWRGMREELPRSR